MNKLETRFVLQPGCESQLIGNIYHLFNRRVIGESTNWQIKQMTDWFAKHVIDVDCNDYSGVRVIFDCVEGATLEGLQHNLKVICGLTSGDLFTSIDLLLLNIDDVQFSTVV